MSDFTGSRPTSSFNRAPHAAASLFVAASSARDPRASTLTSSSSASSRRPRHATHVSLDAVYTATQSSLSSPSGSIFIPHRSSASGSQSPASHGTRRSSVIGGISPILGPPAMEGDEGGKVEELHPGQGYVYHPTGSPKKHERRASRKGSQEGSVQSVNGQTSVWASRMKSGSVVLRMARSGEGLYDKSRALAEAAQHAGRDGSEASFSKGKGKEKLDGDVTPASDGNAVYVETTSLTAARALAKAYNQSGVGQGEVEVDAEGVEKNDFVITTRQAESGKTLYRIRPRSRPSTPPTRAAAAEAGSVSISGPSIAARTYAARGPSTQLRYQRRRHSASPSTCAEPLQEKYLPPYGRASTHIHRHRANQGRGFGSSRALSELTQAFSTLDAAWAPASQSPGNSERPHVDQPVLARGSVVDRGSADSLSPDSGRSVPSTNASTIALNTIRRDATGFWRTDNIQPAAFALVSGEEILHLNAVLEPSVDIKLSSRESASRPRSESTPESRQRDNGKPVDAFERADDATHLTYDVQNEQVDYGSAAARWHAPQRIGIDGFLQGDVLARVLDRKALPKAGYLQSYGPEPGESMWTRSVPRSRGPVSEDQTSATTVSSMSRQRRSMTVGMPSSHLTPSTANQLRGTPPLRQRQTVVVRQSTSPTTGFTRMAESAPELQRGPTSAPTIAPVNVTTARQLSVSPGPEPAMVLGNDDIPARDLNAESDLPEDLLEELDVAEGKTSSAEGVSPPIPYSPSLPAAGDSAARIQMLDVADPSTSSVEARPLRMVGSADSVRTTKGPAVSTPADNVPHSAPADDADLDQDPDASVWALEFSPEDGAVFDVFQSIESAPLPRAVLSDASQRSSMGLQDSRHPSVSVEERQWIVDRFAVWSFPTPKSPDKRTTKQATDDPHVSDSKDSAASSSTSSGSKRWSMRDRRSLTETVKTSQVKRPLATDSTSADPEAVGFAEVGDRELHAATVERWVAEITGSRRIQTELQTDFLLTFRAFMHPRQLLQLLILRWEWAMRPANSRAEEGDRTIVRVRTFVVFKDWLLNYFVEDFASDPPISHTLKVWLESAALRNPTKAGEVKQLQKVLNTLLDLPSGDFALRDSGAPRAPGRRARSRGLGLGLSVLPVDLPPIPIAPKSRPFISASQSADTGLANLASDRRVDLQPKLIRATSYDRIPWTRSEYPMPSRPSSMVVTDGYRRDRLSTRSDEVEILDDGHAVSHSTVNGSASAQSVPLTGLAMESGLVDRPPTPATSSILPSVGTSSAIARYLTSTKGTLGRFKRMLGTKTIAPSASLGSCTGVGAFVDFEGERISNADLLYVRGGLEEYVRFLNAHQHMQHQPHTDDTASSDASRSMFHSTPTSDSVTTPPESEDLESSSNVPNRSSGVKGPGDGTLSNAGAALEIRALHHSISSQTIKSQPPKGPNRWTVSSAVNSLYNRPSGRSRKEVDHAVQSPASSTMQLDDVTLSSDSDGLNDGSIPTRTLRRLPAARDLRRGKQVSPLTHRPSLDTLDSLVGSSYRIPSYAFARPFARPDLLEDRKGGIPVIANFTLDGMDSDDDEVGDVDAALRRLQGHIDEEKQRSKARRVEAQMSKSKQLAHDPRSFGMRSSTDDNESDTSERPLSSRASTLSSAPAHTPRSSVGSHEVAPSVSATSQADVKLLDKSGPAQDRMPLVALDQGAASPAPQFDTPEESAHDEERIPTPEVKQLRTPTPARKPLHEGGHPTRHSRRGSPARWGDFASSEPLRAQAARASHMPMPISLQPIHKSFLFGYRTELLAQQFALIERDQLWAISAQELNAGEWRANTTHIETHDWELFLKERREYVVNAKAAGQRPAACEVQTVIARFNLTCNWIVSEIVLTRDIEERVLLIAKIVRIAWKCYMHSNFQTVAQLVWSLQMQPVERLHRTWAMVRKTRRKETQMLDALKGFTTPDHNFRPLRTTMNAMCEGWGPPGQTSPSPDAASNRSSMHLRPESLSGSIPFLGIFLCDLGACAEQPTFLDPSFPTAPAAMDPDTGHLTRLENVSAFDHLPPLPPNVTLSPLINVSKYRRVARVLRRFLTFQELASHIPFEADSVIYLRCLKIRCLNGALLRQLSIDCEP